MGHGVEDLIVDRPPVTHHRLRRELHQACGRAALAAPLRRTLWASLVAFGLHDAHCAQHYGSGQVGQVSQCELGYAWVLARWHNTV
jgi:hypothetical protein